MLWTEKVFRSPFFPLTQYFPAPCPALHIPEHSDGDSADIRPNGLLRRAAGKNGLIDFDGLVDFDRLLSAPQNDMHLNPAHDSGDHLHPGTEGNRVMAEAVADLLQKGFGQ